jgi:hypothetical protein
MFGTADSDLQDRLASALDEVMALRARLAADAQLGRRWRAVKNFQSDRLRSTYADLLASDRYREPCQFFLDELYGARDFEQRDAEARRVVPKLAKMLPARGVETLLLAVELDVMSERLDSDLAARLTAPVTAASYAAAYPEVGTESERERQIELVGDIGRALDKLARIPMLAAMLHMMKAPAELWGLSHLHHFLARGFDAFAGMGGAREFLATIARRERTINRRLFDREDDPFRPVD